MTDMTFHPIQSPTDESLAADNVVSLRRANTALHGTTARDMASQSADAVLKLCGPALGMMLRARYMNLPRLGSQDTVLTALEAMQAELTRGERR